MYTYIYACVYVHMYIIKVVLCVLAVYILFACVVFVYFAFNSKIIQNKCIKYYLFIFLVLLLYIEWLHSGSRPAPC